MFVSLAEDSMWLLTYIDVIGIDIVRVGITEQRVQFYPVTVIWNTKTQPHEHTSQWTHITVVQQKSIFLYK